MPDSISWDEPDLRPARYKRQGWLGRDRETFYISEEVAASRAIKRDSLLKLRPKRYADGWNTGPAWEASEVHGTMYYDGAQNELVKKTLTRIAKLDKPFFMGYSENTKEYHYIEWYAWNHKTGIRSEFKSAELFDSKNDPHETNNVAEDPNFSTVMEDFSKQLADG